MLPALGLLCLVLPGMGSVGALVLGVAWALLGLNVWEAESQALAKRLLTWSVVGLGAGLDLTLHRAHRMLDVVDVRGVVPNPGIPVPGVGGIGDGGLEGGEGLGQFLTGEARHSFKLEHVPAFLTGP